MFGLMFVLLCFAVYVQLWVVASVTFTCAGLMWHSGAGCFGYGGSFVICVVCCGSLRCCLF